MRCETIFDIFFPIPVIAPMHLGNDSSVRFAFTLSSITPGE